ncbi:type IV pilus assembly protein PilM [Aeromonas simiae]|uniref:type IV pilus assembly protein PilM n=1 Tax=Aeromonas simiae TaxID=218936 RepID=UPI0005A77D6F|nr:type IV pilus assembly protein PilM [Aeromonas simiae]
MLGLFREGALLPLVGVDFGSHTIKAVSLTGREGKFFIDALANVATPKGVFVDYQLQDIERVVHALKALKRSLPSSDYASVSVTGSHVITKVLSLDASLSEADLHEQVMLEAEQLIPFPLDEISLDYESLGPNPSDPERQDVLLSAARTESISGRVSALAEAGWTAKVMDVGVHALGRGVLACCPELADSTHATGIVDIGSGSLTFAVLVRGEVIHSRWQNFGGDQLTQAVASFYTMSQEEAELAKCSHSLPHTFAEEVVPGYVVSLIQQVKRNIQLFCSASNFRELSGLVLTGGGSVLSGLPMQLADELNLEVIHPDPIALFRHPKLAIDEHGARYMTALGLALRSFTPCQI